MVMALSGAFLVLFVTFHCLMNAVAICWPAAYNSVCEFLGANWYALGASAILALFVLIHIVYAVMLTLQNRKARGNKRYSIAVKPSSVEWSSQNMLVLGIVILAFLVVHLIQFWAKMQLQEIRGADEMLPPAAGTLFLQKAFELPWTLIVYGIGFLALWFHLNHGFWSMFHTVGWDNNTWISRLKCIGCWWTSIVVALFVAQAIVFTVNAHNKAYLTNPVLQEQYAEYYEEQAKDLVAEINGEMAMAQKQTQGYIDQQAILLGYYERMVAIAESANALCPDIAPSQTVAMLDGTAQQLKPAYLRMLHEKEMMQNANEADQPAVIEESTTIVEVESNNQ